MMLEGDRFHQGGRLHKYILVALRFYEEFLFSYRLSEKVNCAFSCETFFVYVLNA